MTLLKKKNTLTMFTSVSTKDLETNFAAFSHYPRIRRHDYPLNVENTTQVVGGWTYWRLGLVTDSRRFQKFENL